VVWQSTTQENRNVSKKNKMWTESGTTDAPETRQERRSSASPFDAFAWRNEGLSEVIAECYLVSTDAAQHTVLQGDKKGRIFIWDTIRRERTWAGRFQELCFELGACSDAALSPDGASFVTASHERGSHGVKLHRATDGEVLWHRPDLAGWGGPFSGARVRFSSDGSRLSVCDWNWRDLDRTGNAGPPCHVLDAATGQTLHTVPDCEEYYWNPADMDVAKHRKAGGQIVDRGTGKVLADVPIQNACVFSADGKTAFTERELTAVDLESGAIIWQAGVDELADMSVSWRPGYLSAMRIAYSRTHGRLLAKIYQATANRGKDHFRGIVAVSPETGDEIGSLLPYERSGYGDLLTGDPDRQYCFDGSIWEFGEQSGQPWLMLINVDEEDWLVADPDGLVHSSSDKARELFDKVMNGEVQKRAREARLDRTREVAYSPLDDAFAQPDDTDVYIAIAERTYAREELRGFARLSHAEQVFCCVDGLRGEVSNGGFDQYFFNYASDRAQEVVEALEEIGAKRTARIVERALSVFPRGRPSKRIGTRREQHGRLSTKSMALLGASDNEFYEDKDDLERLILDYVKANRDQFTAGDKEVAGEGGDEPAEARAGKKTGRTASKVTPPPSGGTDAAEEERQFVSTEGKSDRFWNITLDGDTHTVHFGRTGTKGQKRSKAFATDAEARASFDKLISQKLKKGYVEVAGPRGGGKPGPNRSPRRPKASATEKPEPGFGINICLRTYKDLRNRTFVEGLFDVLEDYPHLWPDKYADINTPTSRKPFDITNRQGFADDWLSLRGIWGVRGKKKDPGLVATKPGLPVFAPWSVELWTGMDYVQNNRDWDSLVEAAMRLYSLIEPAYGLVHDDHRLSKSLEVQGPLGSVSHGIVWPHQGLPGVYWATFFGPEYVTMFGRERLLGLDDRGHVDRIEELDDGGLLLVLSESPLDHEINAKRQKATRSYLGEEYFTNGIGEPPAKKIPRLRFFDFDEHGEYLESAVHPEDLTPGADRGAASASDKKDTVKTKKPRTEKKAKRAARASATEKTKPKPKRRTTKEEPPPAADNEGAKEETDTSTDGDDDGSSAVGCAGCGGATFIVAIAVAKICRIDLLGMAICACVVVVLSGVYLLFTRASRTGDET